MRYSFPIRLVALHLRNHLVLVALWAFLAALMTGALGRFFGINYLLLTPEYLGRVNFWSFALLGLAFGALFMTWNLTTYLLCSSKFPFLATLTAPFSKFCLNNSLVPLAFAVGWGIASVRFQMFEELWPFWRIFRNIAGFAAGFLAFSVLTAAYFQGTNKDIRDFLRNQRSWYARLLTSKKAQPSAQAIRMGLGAWRVDTYINRRLLVRRVRSVEHYDLATLRAVFHQNHINAVVVQVFSALVLMVLGFFMDDPRCQIPTGASIFILASFAMSLFGALKFWFHNWAPLVFLAILASVNFLSSLGPLRLTNKAYGLDYEKSEKADYSYSNFERIAAPDSVQKDIAETEAILEKWLLKNQKGPEKSQKGLEKGPKKPKMVFICTSGGGMRAAVWTMKTLQETDAATSGDLFEKAVLMSGASGGMLGAAYFRELALLEKKGKLPPAARREPKFLANISKDLLNAVSFAIVSNDLFYPISSHRWGQFDYKKDRGYLFEHQLHRNTDGVFRKTIADTRADEADALGPMAVFTPFVLNDARRLLISPRNVRFLMQPEADSACQNSFEIDGVDFRSLFKNHRADDLALASALRMNATYPYILPNAWLPTFPATEAMDAGLRDNYGLFTAIRFCHVFKKWIAENTSGVVFVEIRCWPKVKEIGPSDGKGWLSMAAGPASVTASITDMQDFATDQMVALLADVLGKNRIETVVFSYRAVKKTDEASMSFRLSQREKRDVLAAFESAENQKSMARLVEILK